MEDKELTKRLAGQATKSLLTARGEKDESAAAHLALALIGLLAFAGAEGAKILLRTNFGTKAINSTRVVICSLLFIAFGIMAFFLEEEYTTDPELIKLGSQQSMHLTAVFFIVCAVHIFTKASSEKNKANKDIDQYYSGDTILFNFLLKDGWSKNKVQNVAEPLILVSIGIFSIFFNVVLSIPIIICGVSLWITAIIKHYWGKNPVEDVLDKKGFKENNPDSFSEVQS